MTLEGVSYFLQLALVSAQLHRNDVTMAACRAEKHLQVALSVPRSMFIWHLGGRNVAVVAVELWHGCGTGGSVAGRNCKVRDNYGYRGPLFFGVSWHFLIGWGVGSVGRGEGHYSIYQNRLD